MRLRAIVYRCVGRYNVLLCFLTYTCTYSTTTRYLGIDQKFFFKRGSPTHLSFISPGGLDTATTPYIPSKLVRGKERGHKIVVATFFKEYVYYLLGWIEDSLPPWIRLLINVFEMIIATLSYLHYDPSEYSYSTSTSSSTRFRWLVALFCALHFLCMCVY